MAQPPFVPNQPKLSADFYESPNRTRGKWKPSRPGEIVGPHQPQGNGAGWQGPDQGYVLVLAERFRNQIQLPPNAPFSTGQVLAGCCAVALKRASIFGRAPVSDDLEAGLAIWGFLGFGEHSQKQQELRAELFSELEDSNMALNSTAHNKSALAKIVDMVPLEELRLPIQQLRQKLENSRDSLLAKH